MVARGFAEPVGVSKMKEEGSTSPALARAILLVVLTGVIAGASFLSWLLESGAHLSGPVALVGSSAVLVCLMLILLHVLGRGEAGGDTWLERLRTVFSRKKSAENGS